MDNDNVKSRTKKFLSLTIGKNSQHGMLENLRKPRLIPLRDNCHPARITSENEWNQEYYIIYNSYVLEDKNI
ncbi:MAG TPA: hypothetical protein VLB50_02600 [Ignavibacteriaceae bacterium]|nr:hypothetical protein [Ignavibacteriaceae bacterium]